MKKLQLLRRAALALTIATALLPRETAAAGETFTLSTMFDSTFDSTVTDSFVGSGTLSYIAFEPLADGSYDLTSLGGVTMQLTLGDFTFTHLDLNTTSEFVNVEVRGGSFFFSNDSYGGDGSHGGSADFVNAGNFLTTQPFEANTGGYDSESYPLYMANTNGAQFNGTYGAVPEPSTYAFVIAGAGMCIVLMHKKRRARCS